MRPGSAETVPRGGADSLPKEAYRRLLAEGRERTLSLVADVDEPDLDRVHDPLMSPLVWDLGHIAAFEDLWLCQRAAGLEPLRPELMRVYDADETPRADRGELPYLRHAQALEYMDAVRSRALDVLDDADLSPDGDDLNAGGFVWEMLVQHEHQHNETMLQTLALAAPGTVAPERRPLPGPCGEDGPATVLVEGGPFPLGASADGFAYDNERPRHEVDLATFEIDRTAVTNGAYSEFVEVGGYDRPEWWSEAGWEWRGRERVDRPRYWTGDGRERRFERTAELDPCLPVMHVSWYEADAFARSQGRRLPTEAEWEKAATWDVSAGEKRIHPWGEEEPTAERANLDQSGFGPAAADAYADGASPCGARGMIGDAWEWTASPLEPYPGFEAFPYPEYSEVFFGGPYKVLRGGSWATRSRPARATFRNWDHPQRRQVFTGFRCASDA